MTRVFDTFLFCDELDLLECRLDTLEHAVWRHVLVESPVTFQGNPKPLYFAENAERFAPWRDKIIHVVADLDGIGAPMAREEASREAAWQGLGGYEPGDLLLHMDADEIPHPDAIGESAGVKMALRHHPVAVNLRDYAGSGGAYVGYTGTGRPSMTDLRNMIRSADIPGSAEGGWHFTWLGGPEAMRRKVRMFAHPELAPRIDEGADWFYAERRNPGSGDERLTLVDVDRAWPRYMFARKGPAAWYWPGPG